jgi:hypothetical protein
MIANLTLLGKLLVWPLVAVVALAGLCLVWQSAYSLIAAARARQWKKIAGWLWLGAAVLVILALDFSLRGCTPLSPD